MQDQLAPSEMLELPPNSEARAAAGNATTYWSLCVRRPTHIFQEHPIYTVLNGNEWRDVGYSLDGSYDWDCFFWRRGGSLEIIHLPVRRLW